MLKKHAGFFSQEAKEATEIKPDRTLSGHTDTVYALTALGEGLLASGSHDKTVKVWDVKSGKCVSTLSGHTDYVSALTALGGGLLASGSADKTVKVWEVKSGKCVLTLSGHTSAVYALTALGEGLLASGSFDKTVKVWDVKSGKCVSTLSGHTSAVKALAALGEGLLASGSVDQTVKVWEVKSGKCVLTLSGHTDWVYALTSLGEGLLASSSVDNTVKVWEVKSGKCVLTLSGHTHWVNALTSLGEGLLASGSEDKTVKVWDVKSGKCVSTLSGHTHSVLALTALGEGLLASGSADQTIKLWTLPPSLRLTKTGAVSMPVVAGAGVVQPGVNALEHKKDTLPATPVTPKPDEKAVSSARPLLPNVGRVPPIAWKDLKVGELIGNGSYGDVYQGEWQKKSGTTEVVAIKLLQLKTLPETLTKEFEREATLMWKCRSVPAILQLHGVCTEPGHYAMVMEYMPQKSLRYRLQEDKELPWLQRWQIALDMAQGLAFLHGRQIVHRDLKSLNILMDAHGRAKISDFGLAKVKLEISSSTSKRTSGSIRWQAPELLLDENATHTAATDVYSLGMIFWELATRQLPFKDRNEMTVMGLMMSGKREKIPDDCPKALADIIQACWDTPDKRPTAAEIVTRLQKAYTQVLQDALKTASKDDIERIISALAHINSNVLDVAMQGVSPLSSASSADPKADGYSQAAGLAAFGSRALHHAPSANESASQRVADSYTVAAIPKHTPMG